MRRRIAETLRAAGLCHRRGRQMAQFAQRRASRMRRGRRTAASTASMASSKARRATSSRPAFSTTMWWRRSTNTPRAITRPTTGWTKPSASSPRSAIRTRRGRSSSTSPTMPCTGRCRPRRATSPSIAASTTPAGTTIRAARFERQKALGVVPPDARLSERDPEVPAWATLPDDQKRLFVRHMEAYAAILDCADQNIGRLAAHLEAMGELDNTIFVFSSDNGGTVPPARPAWSTSTADLPDLPPRTVEDDVPLADLVGTAASAGPLSHRAGGRSRTRRSRHYKTYTGGGGRRVA